MNTAIPQPSLALYQLRWGIESFYGLLKTRLALENFTAALVLKPSDKIFTPPCIYPAWSRC